MTQSGSTRPLWQLLQELARVIQEVRQGQSGSVALESVPGALRPGVQSLAFHYWRNAGRAQALRDRLVQKHPPAPIDALLCATLALAWSDQDAPYEVFTLVNQAVEAAKRQRPTARHAAFLNACLRRFLRERPALVSSTDADPVARWNHPAWWIARLQSDYPRQWQDILRASNQKAPMALRTNARKTSVSAYLQELTQAGMDAWVDDRGALILKHAVAVQSLPGFAQGRVSVQDAAAQWAAPLLLQGMALDSQARILDACAAPGGKTGHLLELSPAQVTALELDPQRCKRIGENLLRLELAAANVVVGDASKPQSWWDGKAYDAILLDAPCTASGIVRRHPDIRWLRRASDISQLAAIQQALLQTLWPLVKVGGRLLYCTCSVFLAEGSDQIALFLASNSDAVLLPSPGHLMPQHAPFTEQVPDNRPYDNDGFFYALLEKRMP